VTQGDILKSHHFILHVTQSQTHSEVIHPFALGSEQLSGYMLAICLSLKATAEIYYLFTSQRIL